MSKQAKIAALNHILRTHRRNSKYQTLGNPLYDVDDCGNNVQVFCNGLMLAVLKDFADVQEKSEIHTTKENFINWKNVCDVNAVKQSGNVVELPDLKVLKEYVKAYKKITNSRPVYDFGENQPYVNMNFLIDAMEIVNLKTAKAYATGYKNLNLLLVDEAGNYVYTMGISGNKRREKTDLLINNIK